MTRSERRWIRIEAALQCTAAGHRQHVKEVRELRRLHRRLARLMIQLDRPRGGSSS